MTVESLFKVSLAVSSSGGLVQGTLAEGKARYSWPPCTNFSWLAIFDICKHYLLFTKSYPNEEVNCTEPSRSFSSPCLMKEHHFFACSVDPKNNPARMAKSGCLHSLGWNVPVNYATISYWVSFNWFMKWSVKEVTVIDIFRCVKLFHLVLSKI